MTPELMERIDLALTEARGRITDEDLAQRVGVPIATIRTFADRRRCWVPEHRHLTGWHQHENED